MSALYRLRYWDPDELCELSDEELQQAITHFYGGGDRETWQTVQDFSRLVDEQLRRAKPDRRWCDDDEASR